ncbi:MAG: ComEC/Rec2 family competence protein [Planctomycetes bacterium]|nr:ComEC/Rec2 family competence protein [Planctomycetota bacterium]
MNSTDQPLHRPRRPSLLAGAAAVAGCGLASLLTPSAWGSYACFGCGIALSLLALLWNHRRALRAGALGAFAGVALLFLGYAGLARQTAPTHLSGLFPEGADLVRVEGTVVEGGDYMLRDPGAFEYPESPQPEADFPVGADPRRNVSWLIRVERLPDMGVPATGLVKIYAPPGTDLPLNARVSAIGKLSRPRRAGNPGEFDSRARYANRGISHTLTVKDAAQIVIVDAPAALDPRALAPWVHKKFHALIGSRMPRERAAILGATLLGERGNLTREQRAKFVRSGTVHLLVVSGLHVGLLAGAVVLVLRMLGADPRKAWAAAAVVTLGYLFVTGIQPSVLRATSMVVIYAMGKVLLRRPDPLNVLGASALVSLAFNPRDVAELGFQLSYLAVLGILVIAPALRLRGTLTDSERLARLPRERMADWIGASVRISLAVGLVTWPLLAHSVHVISPIMLVTNLLVGPLLTAMLAVALLSPLAVIPLAGRAIAWLLSMLAGLLDLTATTFAAIPYGHLFLPSPPVWWLAGYYVCLAAVVLAPRFAFPRVLGAAAWLVWLALLPTLSLANADEPGPVRVTALDVGQGQCVVLEVPAGPCVVLDCGSTSIGGVGERILAPYLWERGRRVIDVLLISHADADHVNGLPQLFERFDVSRVYVSEVFDDDDTGAALLAWLEARTDVHILRRGDRLQIADGLSLRCLWPDADYARALMHEPARRNEAGLVLELAAGERRVLLPSDVETTGLAGVLPHVGRADVLFAPHQGSRVDGLDSILRRLQPAHVVLSARDSFPAPESVASYERTSTVWRTWRDGAVSIEITADGQLDVRGYIGPD